MKNMVPKIVGNVPQQNTDDAARKLDEALAKNKKLTADKANLTAKLTEFGVCFRGMRGSEVRLRVLCKGVYRLGRLM